MKLIACGLALAVFAGVWHYLAPTSLGGSTTWVVTDGVSMEPRFHGGDLAIVHTEPSYSVGEIVAYHNKQLHTIVLHRIIGREGSRYIFKGDNNNFADFEHPAPGQLIGALWLHIPALGARLQSLRSPLLTGGLLALAFLLIAGGVFVGRRRLRGRERRAGEPSPAPAGGGLGLPERLPLAGLAAMAAIPFLLLGLLAFSRPATASQPYSAGYHQSGAFSYTARADPGPAYEGDRAVTGEPLFTRVIHDVDLRFAYRFHAAAPHQVHGAISLAASVVSTSGWHAMIPLASPQPFSGDSGTVTSTLQLDPLLALIHRVEATTQVSGTYMLTLLPNVSTAGTLAGLPLHARFAPQLALSLDPLELTPVVHHAGSPLAPQPGTAASSFLPSEGGTAVGRRPQPAYLSFGPVRLSVGTARVLALGGIALAAIAAALALALPRPRRGDESAAIISRYGRMIVPVARVREQPGVGVIDVADMDALVRIAEHYDRSILFESTPAGDAFWVSDESGQFRYRTAAEAAPEWQPTREHEPVPAAYPPAAEQDPEPVAAEEPEPLAPEPAPPTPQPEPYSVPEQDPLAAPVIREIRPGPEEVWHQPWAPETAGWETPEPEPAPPSTPAPAAPAPVSAWTEQQMQEIRSLAERVYEYELTLGARAPAPATGGDGAPSEPSAGAE